MSDEEPAAPEPEGAPANTPSAATRGQRFRSFYDRAATTATERYQEAEAARGRSRSAGFAFDLRDRDRAVNARLLAGAVAFQLFLFLVPLMAALAALGLLHTGPGEWKGGFGLFSREMTSMIDASVTTRIVTIVISLFAGAWAGFGLLRSFRAVYAMVWDVSPGTLRLSGSLVAAFLGSFAILVGAQVLIGTFVSDWDAAILWVPLLTVGAGAAAWFLLATHLPRRAGTTWRDLWVGAAVFGIGMGFVALFTRIWQTGQLTRASARYGSLASPS